MKDSRDIAFVRVDVLENWRFWNEFRNDPIKAGLEVIAEADALLAQDMTKNARAAKLMNESIEFRKKKQAAGQSGGLAKAANALKATSPPRPISNSRCPHNKEEFKQFVADNNLHIGYAEEWLDIHKNRNWCFQSGEPIKNWKGALKEYCTKKEQEQQQPF